MKSPSRVREVQEEFACPHTPGMVRIHSTVVYPIGLLSGSPPRIVMRECDHYVDCLLSDKRACPKAVASI